MFIEKKKLTDLLHAQIDELECIACDDLPSNSESYNEGAFDAYNNVLAAVEDIRFRKEWEDILRREGWLG